MVTSPNEVSVVERLALRLMSVPDKVTDLATVTLLALRDKLPLLVTLSPSL